DSPAAKSACFGAAGGRRHGQAGIRVSVATADAPTPPRTEPPQHYAPAPGLDFRVGDPGIGGDHGRTDAAQDRTGPSIVAPTRQVSPDRAYSGPFRTSTVVVQIGAESNNMTGNRRGPPMLPEASIARYSTW
ncbi:MAG TPA: hypothetical protein VFI00_18755, partial [Kribbella sp.]|nr:hypothetical protein [Kribbella sp.]